jgi:hypothetical protein
MLASLAMDEGVVNVKPADAAGRRACVLREKVVIVRPARPTQL